MEPTSHGTDDLLPMHWTDGDSVPWTPSDILEDGADHVTAEPEAAYSMAPFVVQSGPTLWMVEKEHRGWTLAELRFHPRYGFFQERRRATYAWPREVFGAMLSHLVACDIEHDTAMALTIEFGSWLGVRRSCRDDCCRVSC